MTRRSDPTFDGCKRLETRFTHSHKVPAPPPLPAHSRSGRNSKPGLSVFPALAASNHALRSNPASRSFVLASLRALHQ